MSEVKKIDPESRDYDLKDIQVDARFTQTTKEFFLTMGVYLVFAALMIVNLFGRWRQCGKLHLCTGIPAVDL